MILLALGSCSDEQVKPLEGKYSGDFYSMYPGYPSLRKSEIKVSLQLDGENYSSSGSPGRFPAGGSGTYSIKGKGQIEFQDKNAWTADFDWNLILNGKFDYKIKGDSLILTRYFKPCSECSAVQPPYIYRLRRL